MASSPVSVRSGRAQAQREGQRPAPAAHLLAGVDVEQPHVLEQLPAAVAQRRVDVGGRAPPSATTSATSTATGGNVRHARRRRGRSAPGSASRSSSIADVRAGSPSAAHDPRVQLAGVADDPVADPQLGAPARVPRRLLAAAHVSSTPAAAPTRRATSIASAQPAGRPGPHQPRGSRLPASATADVPRAAPGSAA